jgi:hypothetical protein
MSTPLNDLLRQSEGRYLTPDEREQVLAYARDLPARVRAAEEVEAREADILAGVVDALRERYPRYERLFPNAWDRCAGDVRLVLRFDVRAMLAADPQPLEDKALYYLRSILAAYNLTPRFVGDAFALLRDECRGRLSPESFALLEPFLERNIHVLGDIPEPAVAVV